MPQSSEQRQRIRANERKERHGLYLRLVEAAGVPARRDWKKHLAELTALDGTEPWQRLTKAEHYAFWTERFTAEEIREVGASLEFLSADHSQNAVLHTGKASRASRRAAA